MSAYFAFSILYCTVSLDCFLKAIYQVPMVQGMCVYKYQFHVLEMAHAWFLCVYASLMHLAPGVDV